MRRLHKGPFPTGFERFWPVEYTSLTNVSNKKYPFTLISGSILFQFGSGTRSLRASRLKKFSPHGWVEVSVTDAERLGLADGDEVEVASPVGNITTTVRISDTLSPGMLFMPISFPDSPSNQLFDVTLDPKAKAPSTKACAVRLERAVTHG